MSDAITIESANDTVKSIGHMINEIKSGMEIMDRNILGDMNVLLDKQIDTIEAIKRISLDMVPPKTPKVSKVGLVVLFGAGIYVGIKMRDSYQGPKKGRRNV